MTHEITNTEVSPIDPDLEAIAREAAACHAQSRNMPHLATGIRAGDAGSDVLDVCRAVAYHTKAAMLERAGK